MASPFRFLRTGPPKVALLPDALFFIRAVPVTKGATAAQAAGELELAVEALSPFPLAQLYYGWYWVPGSERALIFAAYRRRFSPEQSGEWEGMELVVPSFAAVLGTNVDPATTILLGSEDGVTAIHWDDGPVPQGVTFRPVPPEASDEERQRVREELLRDLGGTKKIIELESPPDPVSAPGDRELVFRAGEFVSRLPGAVIATMDVRDKAELAALRKARRRDVALWRVALTCATALLLLGVGELALAGGRAWLGVRERLYAAQKPRVDRIENMHRLTNRIDDLATKRLLPMEMVTQVIGEEGERLPADIQFTRVHADQSRGLYTLVVGGKTENAPQVNAYEGVIKNLPTVESAEMRFDQVSGGRATFTLTVNFKPGALRPTGTSVVSTP